MRGSAKFSPTSSIIPPVAGITPRKTAWTAATCSTCLKIAANRQVIVALGKSRPASEAAMPQVPPSFFPISTVSATRLIPGVRIHKFHRCINSSIDSHLCFSINARCIKSVVVAPPPKDCSPMLAQIRKSCQRTRLPDGGQAGDEEPYELPSILLASQNSPLSHILENREAL